MTRSTTNAEDQKTKFPTRITTEEIHDLIHRCGITFHSDDHTTGAVHLFCCILEMVKWSHDPIHGDAFRSGYFWEKLEKAIKIAKSHKGFSGTLRQST